MTSVSEKLVLKSEFGVSWLGIEEWGLQCQNTFFAAEVDGDFLPPERWIVVWTGLISAASLPGVEKLSGERIVPGHHHWRSGMWEGVKC